MILPDYERLKEMYEDQTVAISQLTKEREDLRSHCTDAKRRCREKHFALNETIDQLAALTKERDELKSAYENQTGVCLSLQKERNDAITHAETAEACCAEMRKVLGWSYKWLCCDDCSTTEQCEECRDMNESVDIALSTDCGKGILENLEARNAVIVGYQERVKRLEEALKWMVDHTGGYEREYAKEVLEETAQ